MASEERCVCCGAIIPEGQQVCDTCREIASRSDQWKRGGLCVMCRRKNYCKTQCRANKLSTVGIREYLRGKRSGRK